LDLSIILFHSPFFSGEMFENLSDVIFDVIIIIYQYMLVIGES